VVVGRRQRGEPSKAAAELIRVEPRAVTHEEHGLPHPGELLGQDPWIPQDLRRDEPATSVEPHEHFFAARVDHCGDQPILLAAETLLRRGGEGCE